MLSPKYGVNGSVSRRRSSHLLVLFNITVLISVGRTDRRFVGSMLAGSDLDSSLGSDDESDSEINLVDDLDDEDDDSVANNLMVGEPTNKTVKSSLLSDEDF